MNGKFDGEAENRRHTKPCPYNSAVPCVQYPDDSCGCDPCEECEIKLKAAGELAKLFHETYERLAPDFGYKTREASAVPWDDVPEQNKNLMIAVAGNILSILSKPAPTGQARVETLIGPLKEAKVGEFTKKIYNRFPGLKDIVKNDGCKVVNLATCLRDALDIIDRLEGEKKENEYTIKFWKDGYGRLRSKLDENRIEIDCLEGVLSKISSGTYSAEQCIEMAKEVTKGK